MRTLRDFCCDKCGRTEERYVDLDHVSYLCDCGGAMQRVIGMPTVMLDGTDPGFPGAYDKWARTREQRAKVNSKRSYKEP